MTRAAPTADPGQRRSVRRPFLIGAALIAPRLILVWFLLPATYDLTLIVTTLLFVAGLLAVAVGLFRLWTQRSPRLLPVALVGIALVLLGGILVAVFPPGGAPQAYDGGIVTPAPIALYTYLYLAIGGLWQLGLFLLAGAFFRAVARLLDRRAA